MFDYEKHIGVVNGFPKEGISFKDVSPLIKNPEAFKHTIDDLAERAKKYNPTVIAAPESRGFLFASALAYKLGIGFVMVRKKGKLPGHNIQMEYDLEYGKDIIEVREDSFKPGDRVLIIDDLLATGGTIGATEKLVKSVGALPICAMAVIYLKELNGTSKITCPFEYLVELSDKY